MSFIKFLIDKFFFYLKTLCYNLFIVSFKNFKKSILKTFFIYLRTFLYSIYYTFYKKNQLSVDELSLLKKSYITYNTLLLKNVLQDFYYSDFKLAVFILKMFLKSFNYLLFNLVSFKPKINYKLESSKHGFYLKYTQTINNQHYYWRNLFNSVWGFLWLSIRFWILPLTVAFLIVYYLSVVRLLPFNKIIFVWLCVGMFCYWLLSGFVFFIKKYQYGKYTSVIQRFWRRSYILFWVLEAFLFLIFFYFTINSSSEPVYMYDQSNIFKTHLFSWRFFLIKLLPLTFLIVVTYIYLVSLKWNVFSKNLIILLLLTLILTYVVWLEFYQFFHIVNFYSNLFWVYDIQDHTWVLENEPRRTRMVNHYNALLMILKFWHIIFIYIFWIFSILRWFEFKRVRYPLFSANFQNFIILYLFAWVSMYPWFKFYFRKFLDIPYYWFYLNNRLYGLRFFTVDLKLICYGIYLQFKDWTVFNYFSEYPFFYWVAFNSTNGFYGFKKHFVKNEIIKDLISV